MKEQLMKEGGERKLEWWESARVLADRWMNSDLVKDAEELEAERKDREAEQRDHIEDISPCK